MCLDYRKAGPHAEPSVTLVDCESEEEEPVAKTFAGFLKGLADQLEASTRIYGDVTAEGVARALAPQLGASAPHADNGANGYVTWRLALRGDHQWCWLSSNRVPAGFRRDPATHRLVTSEETALQAPEDPACSVLLSCTQESKKPVADAVIALRLSVSSS